MHERALQTKFSRPSRNQPAINTFVEGCNNGSDGTDAPAAASGPQTHLAYSTNLVQLFPGDQCVLIRAESNDEKVHEEGVNYKEGDVSQQCLLIGSIVKQALGLPSERLV